LSIFEQVGVGLSVLKRFCSDSSDVMIIDACYVKYFTFLQH